MKFKLKPNAPLGWAIFLLNMLMFSLATVLLFSTFLWWNNYNLRYNDRFLKNSSFKQKISFEGASFYEKRSPSDQWIVRVYNVDKVSFMPYQEKPFALSPNTSEYKAIFIPDYKTVELSTSTTVVHSLFNRIQLFVAVNIILMLMFLFLLRRILKAAEKEQPFSKPAYSSFRWMALILVIYCFVPYATADVLTNWIFGNFTLGTTHRFLNWQGNNTIMMLITGALVLLCLAESFKQAGGLKEEQELTI